MTNRLARESSPYLLQHQNNPVDWYPWGQEALERARLENKPICLSVGYSACHWCHVMAHESFENPEIALLMNENFINIKVDREERPDLDHIYQNVAQALTRSGGWPLTVFLTPELKPFFGGTYYPPEDRFGRPGFPRVLRALSEAFRSDPDGIAQNAQKLTDFIGRESTLSESPPLAGEALRSFAEVADALLSHVDWAEGGMGGAPKFPNPMQLDFLWRLGNSSLPESSGGLSEKLKGKCREAAVLTLTKMASGGIYDQLGGGFHRYSVDGAWSIPHFEKMLYDNGLLLRSYAQVLLSKPENRLPPSTRTLFVSVIQETVGYLLREMRSNEGAFYAAQDADSEGEEGKYFVWDPDDLASVLASEESQLICLCLGVSREGNFEHGKTVLFKDRSLQDAASALGMNEVKAKALFDSAKSKLLHARQTRTPPATDRKILASWNGLMISGLAWASRALSENGDSNGAQAAWEAASQAFHFLAKTLSRGGDRLFSLAGSLGSSSQKLIQPRLNAYLDDYAFLAQAALDLSRFEMSHPHRDFLLDYAKKWVEVAIRHFSDSAGGGYFFTSDDHETLIHRPKNLYDQAIPSGTAVLLGALIALGELDGDGRGALFLEEADRQFQKIEPLVMKQVFGYGELLNALWLRKLGPVVVSGLSQLGSPSLVGHPHVFQAGSALSDDGQCRVCHNRVCSLPFESLNEAQRAVSQYL